MRAAPAFVRRVLQRTCVIYAALVAAHSGCARIGASAAGAAAAEHTAPSPPAGGSGAQSNAGPASGTELDGVLDRSLLMRLGVPGAWPTSRGEGIIVAVLDNGFYADDPAMTGAYLDEQLEFENVVLRQDIPCAAHGSGVAATIAARGHGPGSIVGIAPAAKILRVSFGCPRWIDLDLKKAPAGEQERLHLQYIHELAVQGARAIDWAVDRGAKLINFSSTLFPPNYERLPPSRRVANSDLQALAQAAQRARARGVLMLAAAGNWAGIKRRPDQRNWQSPFPQGGLYFPASLDAVVAVSCACGDPGQACEYLHAGGELGQPQISTLRQAHHFGPGLDFVGWCDGVPGVTKQHGKFVYELTAEGGTSNATPEITGMLALVWAAAPQSSTDALLDTLQRSCRDLGEPGYDLSFGHGLPNAQRAVELAREQRNP
jgi:subtilisin family serine protease